MAQSGESCTSKDKGGVASGRKGMAVDCPKLSAVHCRPFAREHPLTGLLAHPRPTERPKLAHSGLKTVSAGQTHGASGQTQPLELGKPRS